MQKAHALVIVLTLLLALLIGLPSGAQEPEEEDYYNYVRPDLKTALCAKGLYCYSGRDMVNEETGKVTHSGPMAAPSLTLKEDGTWVFYADLERKKAATGKWRIEKIIPDDWKRWRLEPNGVTSEFPPTRKIVFENWYNGKPAEGPITLQLGTSVNGRAPVHVRALWVIYRLEKETPEKPGGKIPFTVRIQLD